MPQPPPAATLATMVAVVAALAALHLWATGGTGTLTDPMRARLAVTPATTLSLWWHHLWAGLFHKSWGHLAYNLAVFAVAFPFAARQMHPLATVANAYWIGPAVVLTMHLLLVRPLAGAGVGYAVRALDYPLVGFSVMAYSLVGAALVLAPGKPALLAAAGVVAFEAAMAVLWTGPFVSAYHVGGLALGYGVRVLWLRLLA